MNLITIILIGIGLSMDAFSLALAYGTLGIKRKQIINLSIIVGLYHFFMPLFGSILGEIIIKLINIKPNTIVFIILFFIGINLINESLKKNNVSSKLKMIDLLLFGLAVSLDSFSVGIGIETISDKHIETSIIFCLLSGVFTFIGLILGKKAKEIFGKIATLSGGLLLIGIAISFLFK